MVKEYPIGTTIIYKNTKVVVTGVLYNKPVCTGCYFSNWQMHKRGEKEFNCCNLNLACTKDERKDRRHVIFKEI